MLSQYQELRHPLLENTEEFGKLIGAVRGPEAIQSLMEVAKKIEEKAFYLVVLGEFKRGKTTFINPLLGEPILPTGVVPLTWIVTMMEHGPREKAEVFFEEGGVGETSIEDPPLLVTGRGNPGNERGVERVEIFHPSAFLSNCVHLIDAPGARSVFANNTEVTYNFLPKADADLFLLTADSPISQSELAFLRDARKSIGKVFFVQNKIDRLDEAEWQESLEFSRKIIQTAPGLEKVQVYPLSAKLALEAKKKETRTNWRRTTCPN